MAVIAADHNPKLQTLLVTLLGLQLVALVSISPHFEYSLGFSAYWSIINVSLLVTAGATFIGIVIFAHSLRSLRYIILVGLFLRLIFIPTTPILEDDFYRYFFDGSLIVHNLNPFENSPAQAYDTVERGIVEDIVIPAKPSLSYLHSFETFSRVAYPQLTTIYPVTAQLVFALSAAIDEFNLTVWRILLCCIELLNLLLLLRLLTGLQRPTYWIVVYWLNPLLITEGINAAHMDIVLVPFLLLSVLFLMHRKPFISATSLGLAVGVKVWPLLLAPLFLSFLGSHKNKKIAFRHATRFCCGMVICSGLVLFPMYLSIQSNAGIVNYTQHWQVNTFLFSLLDQVLYWLADQFAFHQIDSGRVARVIIAALVGGFVIFKSTTLFLNSAHKPDVFKHYLQACVNSVIILFLLSPTGYPWYTFWIFPLLCLVMHRRFSPVLLLVVTLPLYDLRYVLQDMPNHEIWQWVLVTIIFLPVISLLLRQHLVGWRKNGAKTRP